MQRDQARVSQERCDRSPTADRGRARRQGGARGGRARSSVLVRKSPAPKTTAEKSARSVDNERRPASRTSIGSPVRTWVPCRLAGNVAASFATTRSPGRRTSMSASRAIWRRPSRASMTRSFRGSHAVAFIASAFAMRIQQLARGNFRALQARGIRVGNRERVQWRIHVAGSTDRNRTPCSEISASQMRCQVAQRRFARAIGAPRGIRIDGGVARHIQDNGAASFARRGRERAEQRLRQTERPEDVRRERALEIFALGVAQKGQRRRARDPTRC